MRKSLVFIFTAIVLLTITTPVFAQGGGGDNSKSWMYIAAAFGMAFASGICGLAQGKATAAACEGMARNPGASDGIRFALILGLALIESLALYTLVIIFAKVG